MSIQNVPETTTSFLRLPHLYEALIGKDKIPFQGNVLLIGAGERKGSRLSCFPQVDELAHCLDENSTLYVADCNGGVVERINAARDRSCSEAWSSFELLNENIVGGMTLEELISFFQNRTKIAPVEAFRWNVGTESFPDERSTKLFDVIIVTFSAFYYSSDREHPSIYKACIAHLKDKGVLYLDKASISCWNNLHKNCDIFLMIQEPLEKEIHCSLIRRCIPLNTRLDAQALSLCHDFKKLQEEFTPKYDKTDADRPCYVFYNLKLPFEISIISSSPLYAIQKIPKL
ncbi:MAG: hypothetical protein KDK56_07860 [Simkania sp.]|nr:hypothetical protein [Simkania sp.]MCP5490349.1 hypothetical protein [Chlamydiales bacterium]